MEEITEAEASPKCGLDTDFYDDGKWVPRECGEPADWSLQVSVNDGRLSDPVYRCSTHLTGTIEFHTLIDTTTSVVLDRLVK